MKWHEMVSRQMVRQKHIINSIRAIEKSKEKKNNEKNNSMKSWITMQHFRFVDS